MLALDLVVCIPVVMSAGSHLQGEEDSQSSGQVGLHLFFLVVFLVVDEKESISIILLPQLVPVFIRKLVSNEKSYKTQNHFVCLSQGRRPSGLLVFHKRESYNRSQPAYCTGRQGSQTVQK